MDGPIPPRDSTIGNVVQRVARRVNAVALGRFTDRHAAAVETSHPRE